MQVMISISFFPWRPRRNYGWLLLSYEDYRQVRPPISTLLALILTYYLFQYYLVVTSEGCLAERLGNHGHQVTTRYKSRSSVQKSLDANRLVYLPHIVG